MLVFHKHVTAIYPISFVGLGMSLKTLWQLRCKKVLVSQRSLLETEELISNKDSIPCLPLDTRVSSSKVVLGVIRVEAEGLVVADMLVCTVYAYVHCVCIRFSFHSIVYVHGSFAVKTIRKIVIIEKVIM